MVCELISNIETIGDLLVYPTGCNYYFYLYFVATIWAIIGFSSYFVDKEKYIKGDIISSFGIASVVSVFLSTIMTLIKNQQNIPMLQQDLFMYILGFCIVFIGIWIFKK